MQKLESHKIDGLNEAIEIEVLDEPGAGGACHRYRINQGPLPIECCDPRADRPSPYTEISFQNGPIGQVGVNGISNEALLAIVEHRMEGFQRGGQFVCRENAVALTKLQECMMWLHKRTKDRIERGVEGTSEV